VPSALVIISSRQRLERMGLIEMDKFIEETWPPLFFLFILRSETLIFFTKRRPKNKRKKESAAAVDPCLLCVLSLMLVALAVVQVFGAKILPPFARSKFLRYFGILSNLFRLLLSIHPSLVYIQPARASSTRRCGRRIVSALSSLPKYGEKRLRTRNYIWWENDSSK
jgi:hypothetical protein